MTHCQVLALPASFLLLLAAGTNGQKDPSLVCVRPTDPRGIAVHDASGALYVLDPGDGAVHRFDPSDGQYMGNLTASTGAAGGGLEVFGDYLLVAPASDTDSTVEVVNVENGSVGTFPGENETAESLPPGAGGYDVAVDANGTVYVSNYVSAGVKLYNGTTGLYMGSIMTDTKVLGIAFGPDDTLFATMPETDSVGRFERAADGVNFMLVDQPISGAGGSRVREGAWGITINQVEYKLYVVWAVSKEVTEYTSDARELRYWGSGKLKTWWSSDPETSRRTDDSATSATTSTTDSVNGAAALTPWYVATDAAGNIYVTASDETGGGFDSDVFKYDGESSAVVGRFSTCFGHGYTRTEAPTSSPTWAPTPVGFVGDRAIPLTPSPTASPTPSPTFVGGTLSPADGSEALDDESSGGVDRVGGAGGTRFLVFAGGVAAMTASLLFR